MGKGEREREVRRVRNEDIAKAQVEIRKGLQEINDVVAGIAKLVVRNGDIVKALGDIMIEKGLVTEVDIKKKVDEVSKYRTEQLKENLKKLDTKQGDNQDGN